MMDRRIQALRARHAELELALHEEASRPRPNLTAVRKLKQRKLVLKAEIAALSVQVERA
jgi:hypothetical protein